MQRSLAMRRDCPGGMDAGSAQHKNGANHRHISVLQIKFTEVNGYSSISYA